MQRTTHKALSLQLQGFQDRMYQYPESYAPHYAQTQVMAPTSNALEAGADLSQCSAAWLAILRIAIHKIASQAQIPGMSLARDIKSSICAEILLYCYFWSELLWLETSCF